MNLINAEKISIAFGTRILLDEVSLGLSEGDIVGVVGRNGDGKSTLLRLLTGSLPPDSGVVTQARAARIGILEQADLLAGESGSVRDLVLADQPDHLIAADPAKRKIVAGFLADIEMDAPLAQLSGGERRRVQLATLLLGDHNLLVLDEPTNHLDIEAITWLAEHLAQQQKAMLVVSHDRWFLDQLCNRIWEVHDATVDFYDGGYESYVLARAERERLASVLETRRRNLARKELAWLRRGPKARTSKPGFRVEAAKALIADVPELRDNLQLREFSTTRLGKDVFDLFHVDYELDARPLLRNVDWSIGPGDRIGIVGVNGSGKTTLLRLLDGELKPQAGKVKQGKTLKIGFLTQQLDDLDDTDRVLDSVNRLRHQVKLTTGREVSASSLLEGFGFSGEKLVARIGDLSGGERRRLHLLHILLEEPNVLLLDEPTNDLDIDTLQVIEDYLDTWPGTLIVVTHDRWFLERVTDVTYALLGDGRVPLLPGGIDQYLRIRSRRAAQLASPKPSEPRGDTPASPSNPQAQRAAKKEAAKIEGQLEKLATQIEDLTAQLSLHASNYQKLLQIQADLDAATAKQAALEERWLELADLLE
ncbi:MAG: ABC-F family ATP-binding cassette domain-containing protein [Propionibacteriaceae bacterium]|jgi:ATPase subunit of ABC transporter with duplicated ATPase domains|nr:ABC-F family ATP-binding cassette domain-containing protein [Propionibacteriaceae bacterium]